MKLSVVYTVLDSHEVFRRQLMWFNRIIPEDCEIVMVDDGSEPELKPTGNEQYQLKILYTRNKIPWSIPSARNLGVRESSGEYVMIMAIDHILTRSAIEVVRRFNGDKMDFLRARAILDENGDLVTDRNVLKEYATKEDEIDKIDVHYDTFAIRKSIYEELGGYDEKYDGRYGGCDVDFSHRYGALGKDGKVSRCVRGPLIYAFPNPAQDVKGFFHTLRKR